MSPTINSVSMSAFSLPEEDSRSTILPERATGVLQGALGQGHAISLRDELLLPRQLAPRAAVLRAGLARFGGGLVTAAATGFELVQAFGRDRMTNDSSYRETRRQMATSAVSISAGLGVGSVAGLATAGALIAGAPVAVATAIGVAGFIGVGVASSYAYEWASSRMRDWIPD